MTESSVPDKAKENLAQALGGLSRYARKTSTKVLDQAGDLKEAAVDTVEKLTSKKSDPYEDAIAGYNDAFTLMNDKGIALLGQRDRSTDLIAFV